MAQPHTRDFGSVPGTFSVSVRDPATGAHGVAVATGLVASGATIPFVSDKVAMLTQAFTNVSIGRRVLALVADGLTFPTACDSVLAEDAHSNYRQVHGIDAEGRRFAHTGADCVDWSGDITTENATVAGNMLTGPAVLQQMSETIEESDGRLIERLLATLRAGELAGGDKRGSVSAAVRVDAPKYHLWHNLRVDHDSEPISALTELYENARDAEKRLPESAAEMLGEHPDSIIEFEARWDDS